MKRREFSMTLTGLFLPLAPALVHAQGYVEGTHYRRLSRPAPVEAPAGKIQVFEFFSYNCPHCNSFEPQFDAWARRAPKDVVVQRVPVPFIGGHEAQRRMHYALEFMGLLGKLHARIYRAIHVERQSLDDPAVIADWMAKQGVDKAQFVNQFNSFAVASKANRAAQLTQAYEVEGVPTLGIAGRYITDAGMAKGMGQALRVADHLLAQARAGR